MTLVAGAVIWSGYVLAWWGWLAVTDRVPPGPSGRIWWPSIRDLVVPGRAGQAVPAQLLKATKVDSGVQAGGTAASPLQGTNAQIAGQQGSVVTNNPDGTQTVTPPQNDTFLNPVKGT